MNNRATITARIADIRRNINSSANNPYLSELIHGLANCNVEAEYYDNVPLSHDLLILLIANEHIEIARSFIHLFDKYESLLFNLDNKQFNALWYAQKNNPDLALLLAKRLLKSNPRYIDLTFNQIDNKHAGIFHYSICSSELTKILLQICPLALRDKLLNRLDLKWQTPVLKACEVRDPNTIAYLIESGSNLIIRSKNKKNFFRLLTEFAHEKVNALENTNILTAIFKELTEEKRSHVLELYYQYIQISKDKLALYHYKKLLCLFSLKQAITEIIFEGMPHRYRPSAEDALFYAEQFKANPGLTIIPPHTDLQLSDMIFASMLDSIQADINKLETFHNLNILAIGLAFITSFIMIGIIVWSSIDLWGTKNFYNKIVNNLDHIIDYWVNLYNKQEITWDYFHATVSPLYDQRETASDNAESFDALATMDDTLGAICVAAVILGMIIGAFRVSRVIGAKPITNTLQTTLELLDELHKLEQANQLPVQANIVREMEQGYASLNSLQKLNNKKIDLNHLHGLFTTVRNTCMREQRALLKPKATVIEIAAEVAPPNETTRLLPQRH